jgi:hypothetical protein
MIKNDLTEAMVRNVILTWYSSTNEHRPVEDFETMLSDDVRMSYPNQPEPIVGRAAFRKWYAGVLNVYFDETHELESCHIRIDENRAEAIVIVRWEARSWPVGAARSKYEATLTRQRFEFERIPDDGRVQICVKNVETFDKVAPIYDVGR